MGIERIPLLLDDHCIVLSSGRSCLCTSSVYISHRGFHDSRRPPSPERARDQEFKIQNYRMRMLALFLLPLSPSFAAPLLANENATGFDATTPGFSTTTMQTTTTPWWWNRTTTLDPTTTPEETKIPEETTTTPWWWNNTTTPDHTTTPEYTKMPEE